MSVFPSFEPYFTLPSQREALARRLAPRSAPVSCDELRRILTLFDDVRGRGDDAVLAATREHDRVELTRVAVSPRDVADDVAALPGDLRAAIDTALGNIHEVNARLVPADTDDLLRPGTRVGERYRPLDSVAVYVPTRKGPLISTALMLIGAARAAGVPRIAMVGPAAEAQASRIRNAGELLLGASTPFAAANYAIGVSAVLPTNGFARSHSAVTARDFMRLCTTARLDAGALASLAPSVIALATAEGLPCHAASIAQRAPSYQ